MTRAMKLAASALFSLFLSSAAYAQQVSGAELKRMSDAYKKSISKDSRALQPDDISSSAMFVGYVLGVENTLNVTQLGGFVCTYVNVSKEQVAAVVSNYLDDHPEDWNGSAIGIASVALTKAFPCATKK
jgi:Ssp1 endopeptidase immunity protein Rap1a